MKLVHEVFQLMTVLKMAAAVSMSVSLSILAEVVSPAFAGIFSGYPLGAAIALFFIGLEINTAFAAESALYTSIGLIATQAFAFCYWQCSSRTRAFCTGRLNMVISTTGGLVGYFTAAFLLRSIPVNSVNAVLLPAASIIIFDRMFRDVRSVRIEQRVGLNWKILLCRSMFAAVVIVIITSTAKVAGPAWAGLFSAFPLTMLPLAVIVHLTYGADQVYAALRNVPKGLSSLLVYAMAVTVFYPVYGIYAGTLIAYGFATACLVIAQMLQSFRSAPDAEKTTVRGAVDGDLTS